MFSPRLKDHGVKRQYYQSWYANTNSGTIYFEDASSEILVYRPTTFMWITIIWYYSW